MNPLLVYHGKTADSDVAFADGIAILTDRSKTMQVMTNNLKTCAEKVSLWISVQKTKIKW